MPLYSVTYVFEAENDQEASNIYGGGFYLEADPTFSWRLLEPTGKHSGTKTRAAQWFFNVCETCGYSTTSGESWEVCPMCRDEQVG